MSDLDWYQNRVKKHRPSGAVDKYFQAAKPINYAAQKKRRKGKQRMKLAEEYRKAEIEMNIINHILKHNWLAEEFLLTKANSRLPSDNIVFDFFHLKLSQLEEFIHVRKFNGQAF